MNKKKALIAASVAGLIAVSGFTMVKPALAEDISCSGVNACSGKGQCGGKDHACAGKNACKGKGVVMVSQAACDALGGTVQA